MGRREGNVKTLVRGKKPKLTTQGKSDQRTVEPQKVKARKKRENPLRSLKGGKTGKKAGENWERDQGSYNGALACRGGERRGGGDNRETRE